MLEEVPRRTDNNAHLDRQNLTRLKKTSVEILLLYKKIEGYKKVRESRIR